MITEESLTAFLRERTKAIGLLTAAQELDDMVEAALCNVGLRTGRPVKPQRDNTPLVSSDKPADQIAGLGEKNVAKIHEAMAKQEQRDREAAARDAIRGGLGT